MDNLFPENLYHSYIVEGDPNITSFELLKFLEKKGEVLSKSPDVLIQTYDSFTISDGHKIKQWHSELGISEGKRICIIGVNFINHDAERMLLKIIEEPAENTHFFIVLPNSLVLLDTIRSRAHTVNTKKIENIDFHTKAMEFISLSLNQRIDYIGKVIKQHKDKEEGESLRAIALQLVNEIEKILYKKFKLNILNYSDGKNSNEFDFILNEIQEKREYLNLPGSSPKMILEHLALIL
jgi:hypothetical protein